MNEENNEIKKEEEKKDDEKKIKSKDEDECIEDDSENDSENDDDDVVSDDVSDDVASESSISSSSSSCEDNLKFLETLVKLNKIKKKSSEKKKKDFLPSLKKYLNADIDKKNTLLDSQLINKLQYIAKNIINKKISIEISNDNKYILTKFAKNKIKEKDLKILLSEDFRIINIYQKVYKLLHKQIKKND